MGTVVPADRKPGRREAVIGGATAGQATRATTADEAAGSVGRRSADLLPAQSVGPLAAA
jgi:hypothetical protein